MASANDIQESILAAWRTNNAITIFLIEHLSAELWCAKIPGAPRPTVGMIAGHIHNARCMWIKSLGKPHGVEVPPSVDRRTVEPDALVAALNLSAMGIIDLLNLAFESDGSIPPTSAYAWRNLPLDVGHVLGYFIAHEGHHRGQIVMLARQLGHRLPVEVTGGLWHWSKRSKEF